jgi:glycosyltransferase involved in cell wall biosynthesis
MNPENTIRFTHEQKEVKGVVGLSGRLQTPSFGRSPVDIIVPFHGCYDKVIRLIEGVYKVRSNPYQLTLVDDGSPNKGFLTQIESLPQLNCIRLEKQRGFGAALRAGYEATKQPWVMFMHSDCEIEDPLWMIQLGQTMMELKDQGVKMVSARTNNPTCDDRRFIASHGMKSDHVILSPGDVMPLYCAMCHRDLFQHIGGFIKEYPYAMYEDQELSHRMSAFGFKQAISGTSWIKHIGNSTIGEVLRSDPQAESQMEANYDRCISDMRKYRIKK